MRKSWLVCVLMGTFAWGQSQSGAGATPAAPPASQTPATAPVQAPAAAPAAAAEIPMTAAVLTIHGLCPATPTPAAAKAGAAKPAGAAKTQTAKKDCVTVITRAEFEKIASAVTPNPTPQFKRQLANALPRFMAMSQAAKAKGLDKTDAYAQTLKFAKMQILTTEMQRSIQDEAGKVSDEQIAAYYMEHPDAYQQYSLDRLFVPRFKQSPEVGDDDKDDSKLTEEQQKAKEAAEQAKQAAAEQEMNKLADSLQPRAVAGEDFMKMQKEVFDAAGMKIESPTVNLPKVRRTGLPPAHVSVFDLKVGDVSPVLSDNGGHYIYKVVSKEELPLDQVKEEIRNALKSQRMKDMMDKFTNSFTADTNDAYFGPPMPGAPRPGMPGGGAPPHLPRPHVVPVPAQPPAQPPQKPN